MAGAVMKYFKKVIFLAVYFAISGSLFWTAPNAFADVGPVADQGEMVRLHAALNENLQAEAVLQAELRAAYRLISRPHSEYLLYQKSLGLEGMVADLRQLRLERKSLIQRLTSSSDGERLPMQLNPEAEIRFPGLVSTAYSGAPMLSFDDASRFDSEVTPRTVSARAGFYRLLIGIFLLAAFSLPLMALYKKKTEVPTEKKLIRVFPIFSVQGKNGVRSLFKVPSNRRELLRPKFGGFGPHVSA